MKKTKKDKIDLLAILQKKQREKEEWGLDLALFSVKNEKRICEKEDELLE